MNLISLFEEGITPSTISSLIHQTLFHVSCLVFASPDPRVVVLSCWNFNVFPGNIIYVLAGIGTGRYYGTFKLNDLQFSFLLSGESNLKTHL